MKTKSTYQCQVCNEQFSNITDHMLHYMKAHDDGYKEHADRRRRAIACRGCAKELPANIFHCESCGWELTTTEATK